MPIAVENFATFNPDPAGGGVLPGSTLFIRPASNAARAELVTSTLIGGAPNAVLTDPQGMIMFLEDKTPELMWRGPARAMNDPDPADGWFRAWNEDPARVVAGVAHTAVPLTWGEDGWISGATGLGGPDPQLVGYQTASGGGRVRIHGRDEVGADGVAALLQRTALNLPWIYQGTVYTPEQVYKRLFRRTWQRVPPQRTIFRLGTEYNLEGHSWSTQRDTDDAAAAAAYQAYISGTGYGDGGVAYPGVLGSDVFGLSIAQFGQQADFIAAYRQVAQWALEVRQEDPAGADNAAWTGNDGAPNAGALSPDVPQGYVWVPLASTAVISDRDFVLDHNSTRGGWASGWGPGAYPGDDWVDVGTLDIYHRPPQGSGTGNWVSRYLNQLTAHRAFYLARGKPVGYTEWATSYAPTSTVPEMVDQDQWMINMGEWMDSIATSAAGYETTTPGDLAWQAYFSPANATIGGQLIVGYYDIIDPSNSQDAVVHAGHFGGGVNPTPGTRSRYRDAFVR